MTEVAIVCGVLAAWAVVEALVSVRRYELSRLTPADYHKPLKPRWDYSRVKTRKD